MIFIRAFQFQGQPAFILKAYNPERYLEPLRDRGKEERKKLAAEQKTDDKRLLPLNKYEVMHAAASHMELKVVSGSTPRVKDFLNGQKGTTTQDNLQQVFKEHNNLPKQLGDAGRREENKPPLSNEELEHLTRYLLYEAENKFPEMDLLVVLPQQHRILGKDK